MFSFAAPAYAWLFLILPAIVLFFRWAGQERRRLLALFLSPAMQTKLQIGINRLPSPLIIVACVSCLILALMRPQYGFQWEEVKQRGVDVLIALDVSQSMRAQDISPDRLTRAKQKIQDLLDTIAGDRVGLIAFAGVPFLQCPLTLDYGAVRMFLDELSPELIPVPGSAIAEAINLAKKSYPSSDRQARVLIIITDGEDTMADPEAAAKAAASEGIKIYTIGMGKEGGAPIPDPEGGFKKNARGEAVLSSLDEASLQKIAAAAGGTYTRAATNNIDLEGIYQDIRRNVQDKELSGGRRKRYEERFQWPLGLAIMLLLADIGRRRGVAAMAVFILGLGLSLSHNAVAAVKGAKAKAAAAAYAAGKYQDAVNLLLDAQIDAPNDQEIKYNLAAAYYKAGNYAQAAALYDSLQKANVPELVAKSGYNLGNSLYQQKQLEEALKAYESAAKLMPQDADLRANMDLVRRELEKKKEEKKDNKDQKQENQEQKKENEDQKKDEQSQQSPAPQSSPSQGSPSPNPSSASSTMPSPSPAPSVGSPSPEPAPSPSASSAMTAAAATPKPESSGSMSEDEAQRWLGTIKEDRSKYLQRKFQGQRQQHVEKDW